MKVYTELQPDGYWVAYDKENYDLGSIVGSGKTEADAIQDLYDEMLEVNCFDEEMYNDHAR